MQGEAGFYILFIALVVNKMSEYIFCMCNIFIAAKMYNQIDGKKRGFSRATRRRKKWIYIHNGHTVVMNMLHTIRNSA